MKKGKRKGNRVPLRLIRANNWFDLLDLKLSKVEILQIEIVNTFLWLLVRVGLGSHLCLLCRPNNVLFYIGMLVCPHNPTLASILARLWLSCWVGRWVARFWRSVIVLSYFLLLAKLSKLPFMEPVSWCPSLHAIQVCNNILLGYFYVGLVLIMVWTSFDLCEETT